MERKRAISIRQPYAEQILRGIKTREYRTRPTHIRERVYIYASLTPSDWTSYDDLGFEKDDLPRGYLVGSVEVVACEEHKQSQGYAYQLANPIRLKRKMKPKNHPQPIWFYPF